MTDELGHVVDCGRTTYRPPADLARHVIARDRTCCFPGCARAASRCEIDHCRDWADNGQTNLDNLYALCARHHHLKHETQWTYEPLPDGDLLWTAPTGHTYRRAQRRYADQRHFREPPRRRRPTPASIPAALATLAPECPPLPDDPPF